MKFETFQLSTTPAPPSGISRSLAEKGETATSAHISNTITTREKNPPHTRSPKFPPFILRPSAPTTVFHIVQRPNDRTRRRRRSSSSFQLYHLHLGLLAWSKVVLTFGLSHPAVAKLSAFFHPALPSSARASINFVVSKPTQALCSLSPDTFLNSSAKVATPTRAVNQ